MGGEGRLGEGGSDVVFEDGIDVSGDLRPPASPRETLRSTFPEFGGWGWML